MRSRNQRSPRSWLGVHKRHIARHLVKHDHRSKRRLRIDQEARSFRATGEFHASRENAAECLHQTPGPSRTIDPAQSARTRTSRRPQPTRLWDHRRSRPPARFARQLDVHIIRYPPITDCGTANNDGPTASDSAAHCFLHLSVKATPLGLRWESRKLAAVCLCHSRIGIAG